MVDTHSVVQESTQQAPTCWTVVDNSVILETPSPEVSSSHCNSASIYIAPAADVGSLVASIARCTSMASTCRQKDQTNHAIKQMERALAICKGREGEHPKVTVEVARAHLHFGAALSRAGRHHEALASIKSAQEGLNHVVAWASACSSGDSGVDSIVQQARVLQCAAITAEVMELDPLMNIGNTDAAHAGPHGEAEDLCSKAKDLASTQLYPSHPLAVVVKRVCADHLLGSCSAAGNKPSPNPQKCVPHVEDDQGVIASTTLEHMDALDVQMVQHSGAKQIDVNADDSMRIGVNAEKNNKASKEH